MQYRRFGKLGFQVSALGFGAMRLPVRGDKSQIDEAEARRLVYYAIDQGVNYIDTAYGYHDGNSERFLGRALQGGYRQKVKLATKLRPDLAQGYADFDRLLNEQLGRLQTDHVDFYLLHGLRKSSWDRLSKLGVIGWAEGAVADGRVGHLGFSFHDHGDVFKQIIDDYDGWTLCQIQYNYLDEHNQAGTEGLRYAAAKGLAVVIMEPLLGGRLASPPERIQGIWGTASQPRRPAEWALQWLWNQPEVSVVLSGMSTLEQVVENVQSAARSGVNSLTPEESALVDRVRDEYRVASPIPCTQCQYCMPCPNGVDIPFNLDLFNRGVLNDQLALAPEGPTGAGSPSLAYPHLDGSRDRYASWREDRRASACIQCVECEVKCPQGIPISDWMPIIHDVLGEKAAYTPSLRPQR